MEKIFEKSMIRFQCTLVKFRNGALGLAINDKISVRDFDGDEVFMIYDTESKKFTGCKRLVCYDDNLRNELSTKGIFKKIESVIIESNIDMDKAKKSGEEILLNDREWDVVNVLVCAYALDAFRLLTSGEKIYWHYVINQEGK